MHTTFLVTLLLAIVPVVSGQDTDTTADAPPLTPTLHARVGQVVQTDGTEFGVLGTQHWSLIGRPAGSTAVLDNPESRTLNFVPDMVGIYAAQPAVAPGGSSPVVKIAVGPRRTLTPVETRIPGVGSALDITVDNVIYPGTPSSNGINILTLRRDSLQKVDFTTFDTSNQDLTAAKDFLKGVLAKSGAGLIVIVSSGRAVGGDLAQLAPELEQLGATTAFRDIHNAGFTFSLIGSKGLQPGQAHEAGAFNVDLKGYFAPDSQSNYAFIQTDYVTFAVKPSTDLSRPSTIQVGNRAPLTSQPGPDALGGFLLAVLDRATLETKSVASYSTLSRTPEESIAQQQALNKHLLIHKDDRTTLLFLVSFGSPHNGASPIALNFARLAQTVGDVGGTYEAFYNLNVKDTYSLVRATDQSYAPEAGSQITPDQGAGSLIGVLARGRQGNWYSPVASSGSNDNLDLYRIMAQAPVSFPYPTEGNVDEQNAFAYIGQKLCERGCDLRTSYSNTNIDLNGLALRLSILKDPADPNVNCAYDMHPTAFCRVRNQLLLELSYAIDVRAFSNNMAGLWDDRQRNISLILTTVAQEVNKSLKPPPKSMAPSIVTGVLQSVLDVATAIPTPASPILGLVSAGFSFGTQIANYADGNSTVLDVNTEVGKIAEQAVESFTQEKIAQGVLFQSIFDDWGKLQTLGTDLRSGSPEWVWAGDITTGQILTRLNRTVEISMYKSLLPTIYARRIWNAQSSQLTKPSDYKYVSPVLRDYCSIFPNWPLESYLASASPRMETRSRQFENDFLVLTFQGGVPTGVCNGYRQPSRQIMSKLFDPSSLGVYKPEVYRHWPFPTFYCGRPYSFYIGSSNCNYSTPQLPREAVPQSVEGDASTPF